METRGFCHFIFQFSQLFGLVWGSAGSVGQLVPYPLTEKWESGESSRSFTECGCRVTSPSEKFLSVPEAQGLVLFCCGAVEVLVEVLHPLGYLLNSSI